MKGSNQNKLFLVAAITMLMLLELPVYAAGNCSPYLGQASINELFKDKANQSNDIDDFIEVKIIDPAITFATYSQWTIQACERNDSGNNNDADGCSGIISLASFGDTVSPWLVLKDGSIGHFFNFSTGFDVLLLDESNDVVDYLSVDEYFVQQQSACTGVALPYDYQITATGARNKFIFRNPDGTGDWDGEPSAAALPTEGGPNDGVGGLSADHLSISHDGFAINCLAEQVTLSAHISAHVIDGGYSGIVNLTTSSNNGDWSYVSGGSAARFTNNGNGFASYQFDGSEGGQVVLALFNPVDETISINASDGSISETSGSADAGDDPPLDFDLAGFQFLGEGVVNNIGTQIAGKPSNTGHGAQLLQIQALNTNQSTFACETLFNTAPMPINFSLECVNPNSCLRPVYIGSTIPDIAVTILSTVNLDFSASAQSIAEFVLDYPDSGQIRLRAQVVLPNGQVVKGASLPFVSRPFGFDGEVIGNPAAVDQNGLVFATAGTPFQVIGAAHLWGGVDVGNDGIPDGHDNDDPSDNTGLASNTVTLGGIPYTGVPNFGLEGEAVSLGANLVEPFLSTFPDPDFPTVTLTSFTDGEASTSSARFDDVGIIEIRTYIADGDYLGIGADETSRMTSRSTFVGRFVPDHFALLDQQVVKHRSSTPSPCTDSFTYMGEEFGIQYDLEARNLADNVTENYATANGYAKLNTFAELNYAAGDLSLVTPVDLTARLEGIDVSPSFVAGRADNLSDNIRLIRQVPVDGPFNLSIGIAPEDEDGVELQSYDLDSDNDTVNDRANILAIDPFGIQTVDIRFGRLVLENVHGSELLTLDMPLLAESFDGASFVVNTDDNCTAISKTDLTLSNDIEVGQLDGDIQVIAGQTSIASIPNNPLVMGDAQLSFCPPGSPACTPAPGNVGYIDVTVNLGPTGLNMPWFQYDWNGDNIFDDDPEAKVTFGIFKGNDVNIYIQQIFQGN